MDRVFSFLLWPKREAHGPWKQGRKKRGSITCLMDRANEANKMFIIWLCWLFRFWKGDRELEVRTATYGPGIDQSQHAKSVSHIIIYSYLCSKPAFEINSKSVLESESICLIPSESVVFNSLVHFVCSGLSISFFLNWLKFQSLLIMVLCITVKAAEMGADGTVIGLIFGIYPLVAFVVAPYIGVKVMCT